MKKYFISTIPICLLVISCSFSPANAEESSHQQSPIEQAYGEYGLVTSKMTGCPFNYEYYHIELRSDDIIRSNYKKENEENKCFESKFSYSKYEKDYFQGERYEIILSKYDNIFPLVNWANIVVDLDNATMDIQTIGTTETGDTWFMHFEKVKNRYFCL